MLIETNRQDSLVDVERFRAYFLELIDDTSALSPRGCIIPSNIINRDCSPKIARKQDSDVLPRFNSSLQIDSKLGNDGWRQVQDANMGKLHVFTTKAGADSSRKIDEKFEMKGRSRSTLKDARAPPWEGGGRWRPQ